MQNTHTQQTHTADKAAQRLLAAPVQDMTEAEYRDALTRAMSAIIAAPSVIAR